MKVPDVTIYLAAMRPDHPDHTRCLGWLTAEYASGRSVGLYPQVLSSVVRISTMPGFLKCPSTLDEALQFCQALVDHPRTALLQPGRNQWLEFCQVCRGSNARGKLVADAWFAAAAIEQGCTWITLDSDFQRFPGLKWAMP